MYRNKRYRIGGAKVNVSATSNISASSAISTISTATNPPPTSTPKANDEKNSKNNEPIAGPSHILMDRGNVMDSQSIVSQRLPSNNDDDFLVPPSQMIQQSRYISQRSARMRTQSSLTQQTPLSYFESVLSRCGVELTARNSEISYTLNCDHLKFVIRLRKELKAHSKFPVNVQSFLSGLMDMMKTQTQLMKILSGCIVNTFHSIFQDKFSTVF